MYCRLLKLYHSTRTILIWRVFATSMVKMFWLQQLQNWDWSGREVGNVVDGEIVKRRLQDIDLENNLDAVMTTIRSSAASRQQFWQFEDVPESVPTGYDKDATPFGTIFTGLKGWSRS
nr:uncharacterized protein LOC113732454 [Coffea arabica]